MNTGTRLIIVAGNMRQADTWRRERGLSPTEAPYACHVSHVLGMAPGTKFVRIGTWYDKRENIETLAALAQRGYEEITV